MALPPAAPDRQAKHRRQLDVQVFARGDGLWELDARLTDVKTRDSVLGGGVRPAGTPIHEMLLRLVVDTQFNVLDAGAETVWAPYTGHCEHHGDAYRALIGLNLMRGFRHGVKERLGGVAGCTHLTELAQVLPTAVLQAFAGEVFDPKQAAPSAVKPSLNEADKPFQIDGCHALRSDGEVVRLHHPRWYRPEASHNAPCSTQAVPACNTR